MNVRNQKACKLLGREKFIHGMTALVFERALDCQGTVGQASRLSYPANSNADNWQ
jgi:hypothetical protein